MTAAGEARVAVSYEAGLADNWAGLPPPVAQGVVLLAAHLFEARGAQPPAVVTALWRPWRRMRLAGGRAA
ncbi:phage gp6-like head-tail connector protein [Sphingomonas suaedae]|uniref:Phage gp6-like head-tail connector protein n=1 Tax=Sphingomonas suaedae TaxID=2599297 RepID=A0A518RIV7_9SPHN|nr:phage gp6-like head-tail connector protein [Sphingomonas suaedae]